MEATTLNFCKDCKYIHITKIKLFFLPYQSESYCSHPDTVYHRTDNLVNGRKYPPEENLCSMVRMPGQLCGIEGKLFNNNTTTINKGTN